MEVEEGWRWRKDGDRGGMEQSLGQVRHHVQPLLVLSVPCHVWGCSELGVLSPAPKPPTEPDQAEAGWEVRDWRPTALGCYSSRPAPWGPQNHPCPLAHRDQARP